MILGVILHSANVYSTKSHWFVVDDVGHEFFNWIVAAIHLFRMPAFFFVSGFFCALTLERYGTRKFLRVRSTRILVPLLATTLLINPLQAFVVEWTKVGTSALFSQAVTNAIENGIWLFHLWFLVDVMVFFLLAATAFSLAPVRQSIIRLKQAPADLSSSTRLAVIAFLLLPLINVACFGAAWVTGHAYASLFGLTSLYRLMLYLPFFLVGMLAFWRADILKRFTGGLWIYAVILVGSLFLGQVNIEQTSTLGKFVPYYLNALTTWLAIGVVLSLFAKYFSRPSPLFTYLSDASYSIYLFHHVLVIILGYTLLDQSWPTPIKFTLVAGTTLTISVAIHHFLVLRYSPIRFLFNGKQ